MSVVITVFQADRRGFFLFPIDANELAMQPGHFNIPYGAHTVAPPMTEAGFVARAIDQNVWTVVEDHRLDALYYVKEPANGGKPALIERYQIEDLILVNGQTVSYDGGGPIPSWLSVTPPEATIQPN